MQSIEGFSSIPQGYVKGKTKYIVVIGTTMSGIGKGTFSSSLGNLLALYHGLKVAPIKFDGYLNYDAGTLNPYRHGEVFVLEDGTECDLDLGTYERMLNINLTKDNYLTAGKIFKTIIDKERNGAYLGRDVQFIPHVTGEIKYFIRNLALKKSADVVLIEVGGTVGDIENSYFLEAMRELAYEEGQGNTAFIAIVYIFQPASLGEQKSKAAQLGLRALLSMGIQPHIVICRCENPVTDSIKEKISIYSNVPLKRVIDLHNINNILKVPIFLKNTNLDKEILDILGLKTKSADYSKWEKLANAVDNAKKKITVALTGKYTGVHDSYISILKALEHTAPWFDAAVDIRWIETTNITKEEALKNLKGVDGIIVPGGFGARGIEGKIACISVARQNGIPFLGLCLGLQLAVIEYARNVVGLKDANSTEFDPSTKHPVVDIMAEQKEIKQKGGTMRLGLSPAKLKHNSLLAKIYGRTEIAERHRHRYEVNPKYIEKLEKSGLVFSGTSTDGRFVEFLELPGHPFFVATQAHPEFSSKPLSPNPLFKAFVQACLKFNQNISNLKFPL
jgi:CTP synthase